jgi:triosephosphate isomerase (TIM)
VSPYLLVATKPLCSTNQLIFLKLKYTKTMRKKIVAGNWKMNTLAQSATELAMNMVRETSEHANVSIVLIPPTPFLSAVNAQISNRKDIHLGAQNCHEQKNGAYTGEVSAEMLESVGVTHVLVGHSERRQYFAESHAQLAAKTDAALAAGLVPIFCCGEPLAIRETDTHEAFVTTQIAESLFHLSEDDFAKVVVAYEPVWAIGTGKTASAEQAQAMHAALRAFIATKYGERLAQATPILYGGSCNAQNAATLFAQTDIDGGLIGGAALKVADFKAIIAAAQ